MSDVPTPAVATGSVQSVDRAVRLLALVAEAGEARVGELATELGVHKSTASRLLSTLEQHGLVQQDQDRGTYRLGYGLVELAGSMVGGDDLLSVARPVAADLAARLGETVNTVVLEGGHSVCVDQVIGASSVTSVNWIGRRTPAHATASGKAILAQLPWDEVARLLPAPLARLTDRTVHDHDALRDALAAVRARGWAAAVDEQEEGLTSVAAAVTLPGGDVVAALTVSGPTFRVPLERLPVLGTATADAARHLSRRTVLLARG